MRATGILLRKVCLAAHHNVRIKLLARALAPCLHTMHITNKYPNSQEPTLAFTAKHVFMLLMSVALTISSCEGRQQCIQM